MKIKLFKITLVACMLCLNTNYHLFAQGPYLKIHDGYGLKMSSQNISYYDFWSLTVSSQTYNAKQIYVSLGKGLNFGGAIGYMFTKNIGAELGITYLIGGKNKAQDKSQYTDETKDYTLSSKMLRINPSFILSSDFKNIEPYAKFGILFGYGSIKYEYNYNSYGDVQYWTETLNGAIAIGLNAGVGLSYKLNSHLSLFGEIIMVNLSYAPTNGKITKATYDGTDVLPYYTTSEKETIFVDSYTSDGTSDTTQPAKTLKQKFPFGSIGFNAGLKFSF